MTDRRFETREIHQDGPEDAHGALTTPIYANATYEYASTTEPRGDYRYARMASPTRDHLERTVAALEGADHARAFASGMAAIDAVLGLLSPGDHVVACRSLYAETHGLLTDVYAGYGIESTGVEVSDTGAIREAARPETAMIYFETPTNPLLRIGDIADAADIAADYDAILAIDNTFASPFLQRPLERGADLVVESLTKYASGHSDVVAGAVATDDADLAEALDRTGYVRGAVPGPFECFLVSRGLKTLSTRMERQCRNAREIAAWLDDRPEIPAVHYPGLDDHPNHDLAAEQMADFGAMVSFDLDGGVEAATEFVAALDVVTLAESLGGVESLVEVPAAMTHQDLSAEALAAAGIDEGLVRLSVGAEHLEDLIADLDAGLAAAR